MILTVESISLCVNGIAKSKIKIIKMRKIKKAQRGISSSDSTSAPIAPMDPRVAEFLKKRGAADTTKMYNRKEALDSYSKLKPKLEGPTQFVDAQGSKKYATVNKGDTTYMGKEEFEKKFTKKKKDGGKVVKKAKAGGAFGMLSVKAGIDKNPNPTQADRIAGAKKLAKSGKKVAKKAVKAPKKAMAGKKMMGGGKCKNGC